MYKEQDLIFFDFESTGINVSCMTPDYPIEIGMVFCDDKLLIKDLFQSYIYWPWMDKCNEWPPAYSEAYKIHKIELDHVIKNGIYSEELTKKISQLISKNCKNDKMKPTLVSDNAYFDTFMMHQLYDQPNDFPFHYTTWDINILCVPLGIKKAKAHTHSALEDAISMHHRTVRALEKIGYFG